MKHVLPALGLGLTTCLAASLLVAAPSSADTASVSLVHGTLRDADGTPFAAGTAVSLSASTPSTDLEVGDSIASSTVGQTTTGEGGAFDLRVSDPAALAPMASKDGLIDFEVRAVTGDSYAPFSFTRSIVTRKGATSLVEPGAEAPAARAAAVPDEPVEIEALAGAVDADTALTAVRSGAMRTQVCGETRVADLGSRQVRVGSTSATSGILAQFTYSTGASTTIGVGASTSGKFGSYKVSGTSTQKATTTIAYGKRSGSHVFRTTFRFGKYSQWCYPISSGAAGKRVYSYKVKADRYLGGSSMVSGLAPKATRCTRMQSGSTHSQVSTTANTWSTGASTAPVIGISLTSRAGYTSAAKVVVQNKSGRDKQICGTDDYVGGRPQRVVAK